MLPSIQWRSPAPDIFKNLSRSEVHVWRAFLEDSPEHTARYRPVLSADEQARAERYRSRKASNQFLLTRGMLRMLLSRYVGLPAAELRIANNPHGKPTLANDAVSALQFNVSHTNGMALLAVTVEHAVGIDVEKIDRVINDQDIADRYFSTRESAHLASLAPEHRRREFFAYWTCKEAYLKMQGIGLRGGLAQCTIEFHPDGMKAAVISVGGSPKANSCSLFPVKAGEAHIGAVAVDSLFMQVTFCHWQH